MQHTLASTGEKQVPLLHRHSQFIGNTLGNVCHAGFAHGRKAQHWQHEALVIWYQKPGSSILSGSDVMHSSQRPLAVSSL